MAITEALRLLITADSSGAVKGINDVGRTADRELSRSTQSLDRWGSRLTSVGAGLIGFGAVAAVGLHQAVQAAGELEQAVGGTEAVFGSASGTIDNFAANSADAVGLSEAAFRDLTTVAGAQLKNLGFSVDEAADKAIELTGIGADLAATYGGTTAEAVQALGAAFRGEADPAERFGLALNITAANAKAVELGLAESTSAVDANARAQAVLALIMEQSADAQGQFANESDTLAGRQQRLSAEFENLKAEIGAGVLPVMETLFDTARSGIGAFSGLNDATGGALGKIATVGTVASLGVGGLSILVGQAIKMRDAFVTAKDGVTAFTGKLGGLRSAAALAAGVAGIAGIGLAIEQMDRAAESEKVDDLTRQFLATGDASEVLTEAANGSFHATARLSQMLEKLAATDREAAHQLLDQAEAAGANKEVIEGLRDSVDQYGEAEARAGIDTDETTGAVEGQAGAMGEAAGATEDATSALQKYIDKMTGLTDPVFAAMDAVNGVRDAQFGLADAERGVLEAQLALDTAIKDHGANSAEAREATLGLEEAERGLEDAQWATVRSAAEADSALAGLTDAVNSGDVSMDDFQRTLRQWVDQGFLTERQAAEAAMAVAGLAGEAEEADRQRVSVPVSAPGSAAAAAQVANVKRAVEATDGTTATVRIDILQRTIMSQINAGNRPTGRAVGGPVRHGVPYIVGERGPELFVAPDDGRIIDANMTRALVSHKASFGPAGAGGGVAVTQYHLTFNGPTNDKQVVEAIKRHERRNGPGWRMP